MPRARQKCEKKTINRGIREDLAEEEEKGKKENVARSESASNRQYDRKKEREASHSGEPWGKKKGGGDRAVLKGKWTLSISFSP